MAPLWIFLPLFLAGGVWVTFFYLSMSLVMSLVLMMFITFFIAPSLSLQVNDFFIRYYRKKGKFRSLIRAYLAKKTIIRTRKTENAIYLNIVPIYLKIGDMEEGKKCFEALQFASISNPILKGYYYFLKAFIDYKEERFDIVEHSIEKAVTYHDDLDNRLFKVALMIQKGELESAKKLFIELDQSSSDYIEPFDTLFIEIQEKLKGSSALPREINT